jgi:predicted unusual protein kinase regulating ubiquinone biosynthesis (AarF/ABC1/UbiB family)
VAKDKDDPLQTINRGLSSRLLSTGRIAASAARLAARRIVGAEGETDARIGEALARELDEMKGMAMKVGQILSYFDGVLPPATHVALRRLQQGARPGAYEQMANVIEEAFGQPVSALFEDFNTTPIASASIGQVYRAVYEGRPVAVKVQYPGIRETIDGDFSRMSGFARIASAATAVDGAALVAELRARMAEECDYEREAGYANAFAAAFADDPEVSIPRALGARTRKTVITSEWAGGVDFYRFAEGGSRERRNAAAMTLVRFAYRSLFQLSTLNADPLPGNYLFPSGGPVVFLDFGCVRRFDAAFVEAERRVARVVIDEKRAEFRDAVVATGMVPSPESSTSTITLRCCPIRGSRTASVGFGSRRSIWRAAWSSRVPVTPTCGGSPFRRLGSGSSGCNGAFTRSLCASARRARSQRRFVPGSKDRGGRSPDPQRNGRALGVIAPHDPRCSADDSSETEWAYSHRTGSAGWLTYRWCAGDPHGMSVSGVAGVMP